MHRTIGVVSAGALVLALLLGACDAADDEVLEADATESQEESSSEVAALEERVSELEEELDGLIGQRDALEDEVAALEAAQQQVEGVDEIADDQVEVDFVEVGELVRFNDWDFTIIDFQMQTSIDRADPPRGSYLILTIEVENDGAQPRAFLGGARTSAILVDPETERQYEFDSRASLSYYQSIRQGTWHLDDIGPGLADTLPVVFDIPDTVGPLLVFAVVSGDQGSSGVIIEP